jgi:hypothetical protein
LFHFDASNLIDKIAHVFLSGCATLPACGAGFGG